MKQFLWPDATPRDYEKISYSVYAFRELFGRRLSEGATMGVALQGAYEEEIMPVRQELKGVGGLENTAALNIWDMILEGWGVPDRDFIGVLNTDNWMHLE